MGEVQVSRVAVVTGGGSGLGRAACDHLARAGHRVAVLDVEVPAAQAVAGGLRAQGVEALAIAVDVADRDQIESAYEHVRSELGPIAVLVTSAAVSGFVPFDRITVDDWDRTMRINLTGAFHSIQLALPDMVEASWGRIVTISSAAGQTGSLRQGHYSASKGGVIALTKTVNFLPRSDVLARMIPAKRLGTADDVGAVCAFLCSDEAGYVNGQVIAVNGGAVT